MSNEKGVTLIELMVGIAIGIVVLTGAIQLYVNIFRSNFDGVRLQRFEQTVHVLADTMVSDFRRTGYEYTDGSLTTKQSNNKFLIVENSGNCILFTHSNKDPADGSWKQYFYGYQLSGQVIYYFESNTANKSCANLTGWEALTDLAQITITNTNAEPMFKYDEAKSLVDIQLLMQATGLAAQGGGATSRDLKVSAQIRNKND